MTDVSVIMAIHNEAEDLISNAVQSILNQTLTSLELVLCNDASDEGTLRFLEQLAATDERIVLISNTINEYAGKTRNNGIKVAKGRYIAIMDADDYSYPDRLQKQYEFLEKNRQYGFVCSDAEIFDGKQILPSQYSLKACPEKADFLWAMPFVHATVMIRKECMEKVGGYSTAKEDRRVEDYDLFMRLYEAGFCGYNLRAVLYRYYVNPDIMKRKRLYRYRIDEARVRARNFKKLGLWPKGIPYAVKPLIVGLIPQRVMWRMKNR